MSPLIDVQIKPSPDGGWSFLLRGPDGQVKGKDFATEEEAWALYRKFLADCQAEVLDEVLLP